jgi:hypothetical protein
MRRRLNAVGDEAQEASGGSAVADPVIECERELSHLPGRDLALDDPGALEDPADPQDGNLGMIDDSR